MTCNRCGAQMDIQTVSVTKKRGCLTYLIYIVLLFIPIIGWFALFALLRGSRKVGAESWAVCTGCGARYKV